MPEKSDHNPALKVGVEVSESFAKWLVSKWVIPLLGLAFAFATGAVALNLTSQGAPDSGSTSERVVPPK